MIIHKKGNIFTSQCQTIVNAVNCSGVMGAGIALEFKLRYPDMFIKYQGFCESGDLTIGKLWNYKDPSKRFQFESVLSFPTKNHWKMPSKLEYIEQGLQKFVANYQTYAINSVAFPILGVGRGGLTEQEILRLMERYLSHCSIPVEIWHYDTTASDDLFNELKKLLGTKEANELAKKIGIRPNIMQKIYTAANKPTVNSISAIGTSPGVGVASLEKLIHFISTREKIAEQARLFE